MSNKYKITDFLDNRHTSVNIYAAHKLAHHIKSAHLV